MNWLSPLPLTAVVAIVLFVSKELLEFVRRVQADRRKTKALMNLLAGECELNGWVVASLRRVFSEVGAARQEAAPASIQVSHTAGGRAYVRIAASRVDRHDILVGIPKPQRDVMSRYLLDAATLDRDLFALTQPAHESLALLEHLRESLLHAEDNAELVGQAHDLDDLARQAGVALDTAQDALAALYTHCTGKPFAGGRSP